MDRWYRAVAIILVISSYKELLRGMNDVMSDLKSMFPIEDYAVGMDRSIDSAPSTKSPDISDSEYSESFYVISLQGVQNAEAVNSDRLDNFLRDWRDMCGEQEHGIHFEVCPGVSHPLRGHGITQSFVNCLNRSMDEGKQMAYFFEDDARLFDSSFCDPQFRRALHKNMTDDLFLLLLGGHSGHLDYTEPAKNGLVRVLLSSGLYGFGIPHCSQEGVRNAFLDMLKKKKRIRKFFRDVSPDRSIYKYTSREGKKIYATNPLLVKHPASYSNTWNKTRDAIEGRHIDQEIPQEEGKKHEKKNARKGKEENDKRKGTNKFKGKVSVWGDQMDSSAPSTEAPLINDTEYSESFYVISLQGVPEASAMNSDRLDNFLRDWRDMCGEQENGLHFEVCPGVFHPVRGHGITQSFVDCLDRSMDEGKHMAYFFEDDARLFEDSSFCDPQFRRALYKNMTDDLFLLLLGGHGGYRDHSVSAKNGLVHVVKASGLYGFGIPLHNQEDLRDAFVKLLKKDKALKPDRYVYGQASRKGKTIYAADPLVVKHAGGHSNTLNATRRDIMYGHIWQGKR